MDAVAALDFILSKQDAVTGSWLSDSFLTAGILGSIPYVALDDQDSDGIPDIVEPIIGTNVAIADSRSLLKGNGKSVVGVTAPIQINVLAGQSNSTLLTVVEGTGPYAYDVIGGELPTGLVINSLTGEISGTPTSGGDYSFAYRVTDVNGISTTAVANISVTGSFIDFASSFYEVNENDGVATITVTRNDSSTVASVDYSLASGTAILNSDYSDTTGTLNFSAGQDLASFTVPIVDDIILDGAKNIQLLLNNPVGAGLGPQSTSTLIINDYEEGAFGFALVSQEVYEDVGSIVVLVSRIGGADGDVNVNYATVDGTAVSGSDYTTTIGTLNFLDGEFSKAIYIPVLNDALADGGESFSVTLSSPTNGARLGFQTNSLLTLNDPIGDPVATTMTAGFLIIEDVGAQDTPDIVVTNPQIDEMVTVKLTLTEPSAGMFTANDGSIFDAQAGTWEISGLTATINLALANLKFTPSPDRDTDITVITSIKDTSGNGPSDGVWKMLMGGSVISRISSNELAQEANNHNFYPSISADGRYDVFEKKIEIVSVDNNGNEADNFSVGGRISANGRYVVFATSSSNLVSGLDGLYYQIVMKDMVTGQVSLISQDSAGIMGDLGSFDATVSNDGRYVAFSSISTNLVSNDTEGFADIFLRDTVNNITKRISLNVAGNGANADSGDVAFYDSYPEVSADGRFVAYESRASDIISGDTNNNVDLFVYDIANGTTVRASEDSLGVEATVGSISVSINKNGQFVAYAANDPLSPSDTNSVQDIY